MERLFAAALISAFALAQAPAFAQDKKTEPAKTETKAAEPAKTDEQKADSKTAETKKEKKPKKGGC